MAAGDSLDPGEMPPGVAVAYDAVSRTEHLTYTGVLVDASAVAPNPGLLRTLLDDVQAQAQEFIEAQLSGLLRDEDIAVVFPGPKPSAAQLAAKRRRMAERLFAAVRRRLTRRAIVASRAAALESDPGLVDVLLTDPVLLADPELRDVPLLDTFARAGDTGATAFFFDAGGGRPRRRDSSEVDTTGKPADTAGARFAGVLVVPQTGTYTFSLVADDPGTKVELRFAHLPEPAIAATTSTVKLELGAAVELKAGVPYAYTLVLGGLQSGDARLLVAGDGLPKGSLSRLELRPAGSVERVRRADLVLTKALRLIGGLALDERETRHLVTHPDDFDAPTLALPIAQLDPAGAAANLRWFVRLAQYAALKRDLELTGNELIDVFEHARRPYDPGTVSDQDEKALLDDVQTRVAQLLRRPRSVVEETARALGFGTRADSAGATGRGPGLRAGAGREALVGRAAHRRGARRGRGRDRALDGDRRPAADDRPRRDRQGRAQLAQGALRPTRPGSRSCAADLRRAAAPQRDALVAYVVADPRHDFQRADAAVRVLPRRSADRAGRADLAHRASRSPRCSCSSSAACSTSSRGCTAQAIGINAKQWEWMKRYRDLGGQPQDLPVPGELARARVPRRQDAPVHRARERAAAGRRLQRRGRGRVPRRTCGARASSPGSRSCRCTPRSVTTRTSTRCT